MKHVVRRPAVGSSLSSSPSTFGQHRNYSVNALDRLKTQQKRIFAQANHAEFEIQEGLRRKGDMLQNRITNLVNRNKAHDF